MAPACPEEVDVFTVPHSRMKELVCKYLDMLTTTNFSNAVHLSKLLENLIKTFQEFIAHEQIENQFIMKKLKNKLRSLSIQNSAVCNCHKDNRLSDMLKFLQDGYKCTKKSELDRHNYGLQLRQALEDFTETFLPHMEEEEEVFQPLLMQHFTFEELKQIKATVIQQHFKAESEEVPEKYIADLKSSKSSVAVEEPVPKVPATGIDNLPDELLLKVFSHLNPQELCRSSQVSRRWNRLAMDGSLWTELYPVSWAKGDWSARQGVYEEDSIDVAERLNSKAFDEDADIDEADDWDEEAREIQLQSSMLTLMCKHLLPRVGRTIKHCDLAYSKGLTNGTLYKILSLCPHLEYLNLTQTRVSDLGFKGFSKSSCGKMLKHLDLSGCLYITDVALQRLSSALGYPPCHMTEGQLTGHMTSEKVPVTETANEEQGCYLCSEDRKKEGRNSEKNNNEDKASGTKHSSCCTSGKKMIEKENFCDESKNKLEQCRKESQCERGTSCPWKSRKHPGCRCCGGSKEKEGKFPKKEEENFVETSAQKEAHNVQLDNGNKESQDRSWIKQDHCCQGQRSKTPEVGKRDMPETDVHHCPQNMHDNHQMDMRESIDRSSEQLETVPPKKVEIVGFNNEEKKHDLPPGQTFLPEYIMPVFFSERFRNTLMISADTSQDIDTIRAVVESGKEKGVPVDPKGTAEKGVALDQQRNPEGKELWSRPLEFLSLSGCYQITDEGLDYLTDRGGLPRLEYLDLSGCLNLTGEVVSSLVSTTLHLDPTNLFYCDNILDGPYPDTASGCQNVQCGSRVCCRCGE